MKGGCATFASIDKLRGARRRAIGYVEYDAVGPDTADISLGKLVAESGGKEHQERAVGGGGGGVNTGRRPYRFRPPKRDFRNQVKPEKSHRPHEDEGGALDTVSAWLARQCWVKRGNIGTSTSRFD